ncbi:LysR family transcriptional regulator for bpeEF and oprC [Sinobacterium caligoides]|uniref:LysR family transcriptional regulator for bpeEF and oprC n=1 Tax=Sinobacterium caligoides TaxID=933926 RepID=A0A3N2DPP9_9GAMM|nr:LysR family transcriptional regulator [Sinobacterium caligoides]ROS01776.1 LysR family transcriptional regulator for bpeEF and oprC [Sinobacterium caligoides]
MDWNLNDLPLFVAVAEQQSISQAALRLNMQKSSVSRAMTRLEDRLGRRLLERNSRHLRLTTDGQQLYQQLQPLLASIDAVGAELGQQALSGELHLAVTLAFSREVMAPRLADFSARYPDIRLRLSVMAQTPKLFEDKLDLAIQLGPLAPSGFYAKRLAHIQLCWMCSTDYLAAHPQLAHGDWPELQQHVQFYHDQQNYPSSFRLQTAEGEERPVTFPQANQLEDVLMVRDAVAMGAGVGLLPDIYCQPLVATGQLTQIAPQLVVSPDVDIYAVYASKAALSPRLRAMLTFMEEITQQYLQK